MYVYYVRARYHWGFSVRTYPSAGFQESYTAPPPSTVLGAIAYAYTASKGLRLEYASKEDYLMSTYETVCDHLRITYVTIALLTDVVKFSSPIRYFRGHYESDKTNTIDMPRTLMLSQLFGPVKLGFVSCPGGNVSVVIISENRIEPSVLWSITRIGSKESTVSVVEVRECAVFDLLSKGEGEVVHDVIFYVPAKYVDEKSAIGNYVVEKYPYIDVPMWRSTALKCVNSLRPLKECKDYLTRVEYYIVPRPPGFLKAKLLHRAYLFKTPVGMAIIPEEALSS